MISQQLKVEQGNHAELRQKLSSFANALLTTDPAIPGLDKSIVVSPRRAHLTLGVMSLAEANSTSNVSARSAADSAEVPRTLEVAVRQLQDLKPHITNILAGRRLRVPLTRVDIMKPERGSLEKAHVLWAGPPEDGEDVARLRAVCRKSS